MHKPLLIPRYYDAVLEKLRELNWVAHADSYPDETTQIKTPAVFFSITSWQPVAGTTSGQTPVEVSGELFVVCDRSASVDIMRPEVFIQSCVADLVQWVDGHCFGLGRVNPAVFAGASLDGFNQDRDDYLVWRVDFNQTVTFGDDPFENTGQKMSGVWLGVTPDVGSAHVDDYRKIYSADGAGEKPHG